MSIRNHGVGTDDGQDGLDGFQVDGYKKIGLVVIFRKSKIGHLIV